MKKIIKALLAFTLIFLSVACTVTPEDQYKEELAPKLDRIDTPSGITVTSDHKAQTIFLTWNPVENATYYIVEYQRGKDFLGGEEPKQYRTVLNSFSLEDKDLEKDKRYLFRIIAVHEERNDKNIVTNTIKSDYTDYYESAIIDYLSVSRVIQDNKLEIYPTYSKNTSVLDYNELFDVEVKIYNKDYEEGAIVDDSWEILNTDDLILNSNTEYSFTAALFVNKEQVDIAPIKFRTSINYVPDPVASIQAVNNEKDNILLTWEPIKVAQGVVGEAVYSIQKKLSTDTKWKYIMDTTGEKESPLILTETTYTDRDVVSDVDYDYRVVSGYNLSEYGSVVMQKESDATVVEKCHLIDTKPLAFTAEIVPSTEKNKFSVNLHWDMRSADLLENQNISFKVLRKESNPKGEAIFDSDFECTTNSYTDVIELTDEEHYATHVFYYELQYLLNKEVINTETITAKNSHDDSVFMYEIKGTRSNIDFIESFTVNKDSATPYAKKIILDWNLTVKEKVELDVNKLSLTLTRRDINSTSVETLFSNQKVTSELFDSATGSYIDETAQPGQEYKYQLEAKYIDPESVYNEFSSLKDSSIAVLLSAPSNFTATKNLDDTTITLSWDVVPESNGYKIGYKKELDSEYKYLEKTELDNPETKSIDLTSEDGLLGGVMYDFVIESVDSEKNKTASSYTQGCFIGPIDFNVENGADYIKLTWDKQERIKGYKVNVYDSTGMNLLYSVPVDAQTPEFLLDSNNLVDEVKKASEFPLSEEYGFSVIPSGLSDESKCEIKKGNWIRPPKNITATKAAYRDLVTISWDPVDGVSEYKIYRKDHGTTNDWEYLTTSAENTFDYLVVNQNAFYDFAVSSIRDRKEGPIQNIFKNESNYGYILAAPKNVIGTDLGNDYLKFSWIRVDGATEYIITLNSKSLESDQETIILDSDIDKAPEAVREYSDKSLTYNPSTRVVDLYLKKSIHAPVKYSVNVSFSVAARNRNAAIPSKNTTSPVGTNIMYLSLSHADVENLIAYNLNSIFRPINESFEGDWWGSGNGLQGSKQTYPNNDMSNPSIYAENSHGSTGLPAVPSSEGFLKLVNYVSNSIYLNGYIDCIAGKDNTAGYLGIDPLKSIKTKENLVFQLPGKFNDISVSFTDYNVNSNSGQISITFGSDSWTVDKLPVGLLQEV